MKNSCVDTINRKIIKLEREVLYFENKGELQTFHRDGQVFENTREWQDYWYEVADHKSKIIEEYYNLLKIVNKQGIGDIKFPVAPLIKTRIKDPN
jgi:hypothetical protein